MEYNPEWIVETTYDGIEKARQPGYGFIADHILLEVSFLVRLFHEFFHEVHDRARKLRKPTLMFSTLLQTTSRATCVYLRAE